jgi:hypothetical protein
MVMMMDHGWNTAKREVAKVKGKGIWIEFIQLYCSLLFIKTKPHFLSLNRNQTPCLYTKRERETKKKDHQWVLFSLGEELTVPSKIPPKLVLPMSIAITRYQFFRDSFLSFFIFHRSINQFLWIVFYF